MRDEVLSSQQRPVQLSWLRPRDQTAFCVFCGGPTESRDHIPAKAFLDEPHPLWLPTVPACRYCNGRSAIDEEYMACLIECAIVGSANPASPMRVKTQSSLLRHPRLLSRLVAARESNTQGVSFRVEEERVRAVVSKMARGHAALHLRQTIRRDPDRIVITPLGAMNADQRADFEGYYESGLWPEVGSASLSTLVVTWPDGYSFDWIVCQPDRYRYIVLADSGVVVRMIFSEYLACEVSWQLNRMPRSRLYSRRR